MTSQQLGNPTFETSTPPSTAEIADEFNGLSVKGLFGRIGELARSRLTASRLVEAEENDIAAVYIPAQSPHPIAEL